MADNLTKAQRSFVMSRIRSKWTSAEKAIHAYFRKAKIPHRMHPKIKGSPDVIFPARKTAIFIHGCFWHKCARCYKEPKTNREYWLPKIERNVRRDRKNERVLRAAGWKVIKIWEHDFKKHQKTLPQFLERKLAL